MSARLTGKAGNVWSTDRRYGAFKIETRVTARIGTRGPASFKPLKQKPPKITVQRDEGGAIYISSDHPLPEGYVNQEATASRRAHLVERLYEEPVPADVIVV